MSETATLVSERSATVGPMGPTTDRDPRVERTRIAVLDATRDLLAEVGVERTCIEMVAERSGVARSTIYRHWDNKPALVMDALERIRTDDEAEFTGDHEADLREIATKLGEMLRSPASRIMADLTAAADRDPQLAELHRTYIDRKRARVMHLIRELQADGRIDPALDPSYVADMFAGPLFYRRYNMGDPMTDEEAQAHVSELLRRSTPPS